MDGVTAGLSISGPDVASLSLSSEATSVHSHLRARRESGWKEIVSALTEARKLLPTFN